MVDHRLVITLTVATLKLILEFSYLLRPQWKRLITRLVLSFCIFAAMADYLLMRIIMTKMSSIVLLSSLVMFCWFLAAAFGVTLELARFMKDPECRFNFQLAMCVEQCVNYACVISLDYLLNLVGFMITLEDKIPLIFLLASAAQPRNLRHFPQLPIDELNYVTDVASRAPSFSVDELTHDLELLDEDLADFGEVSETDSDLERELDLLVAEA
jgi:hypothetical protein